jgi:hypothetical protein
VTGLNFTADGWCDAGGNKFVGLTYHFMETKSNGTLPIWVLRSSSCNIIPLEQRSTAIRIADKLRERICNDFPGNTTIGTGVSDRGKNYYLACKLVESSLEFGSDRLPEDLANINVEVDHGDNEEIREGERFVQFPPKQLLPLHVPDEVIVLHSLAL